MKNGKWRQAGTEGGAGDYEILARGLNGSWLGRKVATGGNSVSVGCNRVRLVPEDEAEAELMSEMLPDHWKRPCGEPGCRTYRFSTVVSVGIALLEAIEVGRQALKAANASVTENKAALARAVKDVKSAS